MPEELRADWFGIAHFRKVIEDAESYGDGADYRRDTEIKERRIA